MNKPLKKSNNIKIAIVIPVHNEALNIESLSEEIYFAFKNTKYTNDYEVIWVDDGSRDNSADILSRINSKHPEQRYIVLMRMTGQSAAIMAGIDNSNSKYIATLDGDGQDDPKDLVKMINIIETKNVDLVVGWRKNRWKGNFFRRIPSIIANIIIRMAFKLEGIHDAGCAVKVGKKEIFKEIKLYGELHRFITYIAGDLGARIEEISIQNRSRKFGKSKYGLKRTFTVIMDIINLKFVMMKKTTPIQVVGPISLFLFLLSIITSLITLIMKIYEQIDITGNPLFLVSIILFLTSTQFIFYGLIGELVIRTYYENGTTKRYMIRETSEDRLEN